MSNEVTITVKVTNNTKSDVDGINKGVKSIGTSAKQSSDQIDQSFVRARDSLGRFVKDSEQGATRTKKDFQDLGSIGDKASSIFSKFSASLLKGLDGPAKQVADFAGQVDKAGFSMASAGASGTAASGGINLLVGAVGTAAAAIPVMVTGYLALGPALSIVAGTAAAAATALAGVGLSVGVLSIGFGGIGAALTAHTKQMAGAGKAASDTAEQEHAAAERIRSATITLKDAKESEKQASQNVTKAIAEEIDRRKQLSLDLASAAAAASDAKQAVVEAEEKNRRAQIAGSDWEKAEAANALADAKAEYDQRVGKVQDLTKEKDKAAKTSVAQSDIVSAASQREKGAQEAVTEAQHNLGEAQRKQTAASSAAAGGVNAFNAAMAKLSPNAQKLVYALLSIEQRFDGIKKRVQDRLLDGFDKSVTDLANTWLPKLDDLLGNIADHLNSLGKAWMKSLGSSDFVKDIEKVGKGFGGFIDQMSGTGTALIDMFGRLAAAGVPVLKVIGGFIESIAKRFDAWIKSADKSGKLDNFMAGAAKTLQTIFDIITDLMTIAADLIEIFFPSSQKNGQGALDAIDKALKSLDKYLKDPKTQKNIADFLAKMQELYNFVVNDLGPIFVWLAKTVAKQVGNLLRVISDIYPNFKTAGRNIGKVWDDITSKASGVFSWFGKMGSWLSRTLSGSFDGLKNGFRNVMNWVIGKWDSLNFTMPAMLGGGTYGVGTIPYMASGGIANGLTMINERGAELVKLPSGGMVYPSGQSKGMASQGSGKSGGDTVLYVEQSGNQLVDVLIEALAGKIRKRGGNVQAVLGTRGSAVA